MIGGFLTEVNVTSPTGIQEMGRLDGTRYEPRVLDRVEARARRPVATPSDKPSKMR